MSRGQGDVVSRNGNPKTPLRRVLLDAGPLVALLNVNDPQHDLCDRVLKRIVPPMLTCWAPLVEAAYLLRADHRAITRMLGMVQTRTIQLLPISKDDLAGIGAYLARYVDRRLQLADACLARLAERERLVTLFTLDRRDFDTLVLLDGRSLTLVPERGE